MYATMQQNGSSVGLMKNDTVSAAHL